MNLVNYTYQRKLARLMIARPLNSLCNNARARTSARARSGLYGILDGKDDVNDGRYRVLGSR